MNQSLTPYRLQDHDLLLGEAAEAYPLRVRDLPNQEKPREKLLQAGPTSLSVAELLAILLGVGTRREELMQMAQRIVKEYGEHAVTQETNPQRLAEALGIPLGKACQIVACFELGRRFYARPSARTIYIRNEKQAFAHWRDLGELNKEQLRGLYLGSRYQLVHEEVISIGTLTSSLIHPREVFAPALEHSAIAVIIGHNHPSGTLKPTRQDIEATLKLAEAGRILGIDLVDHLIIARQRYLSLAPIIREQSSIDSSVSS